MKNDEEDHALVADEVTPTEFALMANTSAESKKIETLKQEKEWVDGKLAGLLTASKNLDNLIESQRPSPTVESTLGDDQNRTPSVFETVASPITPKPFIKKRVKNSFTPKPVAHRPYRPSVRTVRRNMNSARPNRTTFNKQAHSYANRPFQRISTVRSQYRVPWVPTVNKNFPPVNRKFSTGSRNFPTANRKFPTTSRKFPAGSTKCSTVDMGIKGKAGSSQNNIDDKGYWDIGCSRHMTGNISYLSDFKPFDEGYVSFGQEGCKITGKGTIKTDKLEFENMYFVKDLKYNLFSVSQICDNKNSVLLTDSECIVLGRDFKLLDDPNILLRTPRQHNMYSIDLNNNVPHRDLTCLVAKASADECILWHRRLGKFEEKGDKGYIIGYSMSSKEFRVFNKRTRRVEENLHVKFLENKAIEKGAGPNCKPQDHWSTEVPEGSGNLNLPASTSNPSADQMETLTVETPIPTVSSPVLTAYYTDSQEPSSDARLILKRVDNQEETPSLDNILSLTNRFEDILGVTTNSDESNGVEADISNMETSITASPTPTLIIHKDHPKSQIIGHVDTPIQTRNKSKDVGEQSFIATIHQKIHLALLQFCLFSCFLSQVEPKKIYGALQDPSWVLKNKKDERGIVIRNKARLVAQGHTQEEGIDYDEVFSPVARIEAIRLFLAYASFMGFTVYQMDVKNAFLYGIIDEEVPMGELNFFLGLQVLQKEDGIFLSQNKYIGDILKKFRYSKVRSSNTPMDKENPWGKDGTGKDVDLHLYRSMIGSLMYLTASRPDIMFAGHPKLGLWYPKESPFDLVAYSDSDYGGATQDRKSTTGGCQFLGRRLSMLCETLSREISTSILRFNTIMATLQFCDYHNMVAILEKSEQNVDFHPMVDFIKASPLSPSFSGRIVPLFDTMLVQQGEGSGTPTEPHHTPSLEAQLPSTTTHSSPTLPPVTTTSIPVVNPSETTPIRQYTQRARIAQSFALPTVADEPDSSLRDVSQGEACPTDFGFIADQDRATIAKSSTMAHDLAPRVTSLAADKGSMQQTISKLTALCTSLQRQHSELLAKFQAQEVEINRLKERVKLIEDRDGVATQRSKDNALIKGRSVVEGEAAAERISDDSEEMETILTSMDVATVLAGGIVDVPTGSGSIPTASSPADEVPTRSDVVPTASLVFATATVIDAQVARELEEQLEREGQRRSAQIARDAEIERIHVKEELQIMINGLDRNNETVAKYLQEYHQFTSELPIERRIELINDLVKYQDNYTKVHKFQSQQRKPWTKKQKRDYYMAVIRSNLRWKVKDFRGMKFEEVKAKFNSVWKQIENFIPIGSKEEAEREVKEMMQLVPIEEVYVEALQVKHPIIDWKVHTEGQRSYWKITRLGGSSASYQFFIDLLKHLDREDLNQLCRLVKETLSNRPPTKDKEMELWNFMHAPVEWKLYDSCGVHHVTAKDKEIFMLVEKDYPLRKGLALVMISYKLQVENYSQMANDLILKIYKIANSPRQQVIEFPQAEELPTTSKEGCHCQKKRDATARKIALLSKSRRNCQSK
nr:hypothetical protein [Tanacetum cinerariifolium]